MNKLGTKLGAIAMSAAMALTFTPSAVMTTLAAGTDSTDATTGGVPVYGCYNPNSGEHYFTVNAQEVTGLLALGWQEGDVKWYAPEDGDEVYCLYNPNVVAPDGTPLGDHHYTADKTERDNLLKAGWKQGDLAFYSATKDDLDRDAVYCAYNPNAYALGMSGAHQLTVDVEEYAGLVLLGWSGEGEKFYGYAEAPVPPVEELTVSIDNTTPKVEDTLTVTVEDADGEDVDLTTGDIQWYAGNEPIVGETDDTLEVTDAMVGLQIFVEFTDAEGKTYESDPTEPVYAYSFEIEDAKATKVNEITVTFANPVESENVTFAVTKGTESVPIEKVEATDWSLDEDEVTLKTSANMVKGTYTVTATDSVTKDTAYANFEVEAQKVDSIVILAGEDKVALTGNNELEAYAYYDVFDQYNQSMRSSASIQWTGSCDIKADKATGKLTFKKNEAGKTWVYNEKIYVTGVHIKTGKVTSETLTVGTKQSLDSIEMVGFLKKGTSDIIKPEEKLPKDFKSQEYYLLFHALDQNGNPIDADQVSKEDVTFTSDNVLVVKEITFDNTTEKKGFTVKGEEYNGIFITPGIKVSEGGEVNVSAIANKTGRTTKLNFIVGDDPVPVSFDIDAPSGIVADGDKDIVIPFTALDQHQKPITNFRALAKQEIFNTLSFNASEGTLTLAETDSGAAELTWTDDAKYIVGTVNPVTGQVTHSAWNESATTDDIDRPISLTVVVVGGEADNQMMYVSDKRRPNAIADVNLDDVVVEGKEDIAFTLGSFQYYDQYGKIITGTDDKKVYGDGSGFFKAAKDKELKNLGFKDYDFGVRIENAGTGKVVWNNGTTIKSNENLDGNPNPKKAVVTAAGVATNTATYKTTLDIKSVASGEGFKFDIAKIDTTKVPGELTYNKPSDWESVSPSKYQALTVVDITQVKNLAIDDLHTFYTGELPITGDGIIAAEELDNLKATDTYYVTDPVATPTTHKQHVVVKGVYGGSPVTIPDKYYTIEAKMLKDEAGNDNIFDHTVAGKIALSDLYDKTSANGTTKPANDEVKATIYKMYGDDGVPEQGTAYWYLDPTTGEFGKTTAMDKDTATATITTNQGKVKVQKQIAAANAELPADQKINNKAGLDELLAFNTTDAIDVETAQQNYDKAVDDLYDANADLESAKTAQRAAEREQDKAESKLTEAEGVATAKGALVDEKGAVEVTFDTDPAKAVTALTGIDTIVEGITKDTTDSQIAGTPGTAGAIELPGEVKSISDATKLANASSAVREYYTAVRDKKKADAEVTAAQTNVDAATADAEAAAEDVEALEGVVATAETGKDHAAEALLKAQKAPAKAAAAQAGTDFENAAAAKVLENNNGGVQTIAVYETATKAITLSDQAPYAKAITDLQTSYTLKPTGTGVDVKAGVNDVKTLGIVDQYGVAFKGDITYTISNATEDKDGYAENNFKVTGNGSNSPMINGAELGDTFDLTVSVSGTTLKTSTKVTIGADKMASIVGPDNNYTKRGGLKEELEKQRKLGLQ